MIRKRPGYLMIELLLVIGVVVGTLGFFYTNIYVPEQKSLKAKEDLKNQIVIKRVINQYIKVVAQYNKGLYGKNDIVLSENFVALEPLSGIQADRVSFRLDKTIVDQNAFLAKDLLQAKCIKVNELDELYHYRCLGVGSEISFLEIQKTNTIFNNIYANDIPIFSLKKLIDDKFVGRNEFSFLDTYLMFREKSLEKLDILRKRMETFNKVVYINEIGNPCSFSGGLDSWDDFNIPWIWKIHGKGDGDAQNEICEMDATETPAVESIVCACGMVANNNDKWATEDGLVVLNANVELERYQQILTNLSLPRIYKYDEVGNPITIMVFSEIDQDIPTALTNAAPNPPRENYSVAAGVSINKYKQGELFVRPGDVSGGGPDFIQGSRVVFFYD